MGADGETRRARARELARQAVERGDAVDWFETLYDEAERGAAVVPWADLEPNPQLVRWLDQQATHEGRALDVGCGYGDNAAELAARGYTVDAFDVSATAVAHAKARFADAAQYAVHDARTLPEAWAGRFDLVSEIYTLQVLPPEARREALASLARAVAPGGTLLLIARGRDRDEPATKLPWPLTRDELDAVLEDGRFEPIAFEDRFDDEDPPVRRFIASYRRVAT